MEAIDKRIRDAFSAQDKLDNLDVQILEGLSVLGPRNLSKIAKNLGAPSTTVRYRVQKMLSNSLLFLHLNPYHTYMGLKKSIVFMEATPGYEDILLESLRVNDFWLYLARSYGPYEGCVGIWTIPKKNAGDFIEFLDYLVNIKVARSYEINWSTCFEGVPVLRKWFDPEKKAWFFDWESWMRDVKTIEGSLPITLIEPDDWPIKIDYTDLLIIKELEIDGRKTLTNISKKIGIPLETVKYHFREHVLKRGLVEGYQIEIYRSPSLVSESIFFKFEFDSHEKFKKFALSLHDKPFPFFMGKVLGENALLTQVYLSKWEFRRFIVAISDLIKKGS
ncbi:transcriptional regulator [Thaumarchaeota archaeon SCGC AB-539-E09]|nr:transcriptional regulator [Thaumarchaeota archaeon SCGC AB-539-E09]